MKFSGRICGILLLLVILAIFIYEELVFGHFYIQYMDSYSSVVLPNSTLLKGRRNHSIAIAVIIGNSTNRNFYPLAIDSVHCYSLLHGYDFHLIEIASIPNVETLCPHKDIMFKRHCILSHKMSEWNVKWILFLDADMGIINPLHLVEEYLPTKRQQASVMFYNRLFNHEVMAGSYLIRNNNRSLAFLKHWAGYEFKVPNSFHGTDNGALHSALISFFFPEAHRDLSACELYWNRSTGYETLSIYEVCAQRILNARLDHCGNRCHLKIYPKGKGWARDGWLTNSVWGPSDFIFHGWQERRRNKMIFARWHSPLENKRFEISTCNTSKALSNWRYKDSFISTDEEVRSRLQKIIDGVTKEFVEIEQSIDNHI